MVHVRPVWPLALSLTLVAGCIASGADSTEPTDDDAGAPLGDDARVEETFTEDTRSAPDVAPIFETEDTGLELDAGATDTGADTEKPAPVDTGPPASVKHLLTIAWKGQETGYWCGPGSTRIAISARLTDPPSQTTLAKFMGTTTAGTDHVGLVCNALNKYLATSKYRTKVMNDPPTAGQRAALKSDVLALIGSGWPIVANVVSGWRPPGYPGGTIYHYVAIIGYDEAGEKVLIADPAADGAAGSSWSKVPRTYWISIANAGTWIGGKGYTGL